MAPQQAMRASPALLAFVQLLTLPRSELEQVVEEEVSRNPALERFDTPVLGSRSLDVEAVADPPSERDRIRAEVALVLPEADRPIADYVVDSLDERGFLDSDLANLARTLGVERLRVERVVEAL